MVRSRAAEDNFKNGMAAFRDNRAREAMALFEVAVTLDARKQQDGGKVDPRYRSFYGLCVAFQGGKFREGLSLCRKAAEDEFYNHEIWMNLGRVEMEAGNKEKAHDAFRRGMHLAPAKQRKQFQRMLEVLGMRRRPFFSFLPRTHGLNRLIGRMSWRDPPEDDD